MNGTWIDRLRRVDQQRASFPGEHWLVATAGMYLLRRKGLLSKAAGAAMLYRAASGRDGLRRLLAGGDSVRRPALERRMHDAGIGGHRDEDVITPAARRAPAGRSAFASEDPGGFPERGAGSAYEPRGNPAVSGNRDSR